MHKSFIFIDILERRKVDIFSTCVFNNMRRIAPFFYPFFRDRNSNKFCNYIIMSRIDF
jgi:hypothetical protein